MRSPRRYRDSRKYLPMGRAGFFPAKGDLKIKTARLETRPTMIWVGRDSFPPEQLYIKCHLADRKASPKLNCLCEPRASEVKQSHATISHRCRHFSRIHSPIDNLVVNPSWLIEEHPLSTFPTCCHVEPHRGETSRPEPHIFSVQDNNSIEIPLIPLIRTNNKYEIQLSVVKNVTPYSLCFDYRSP